MRKFFSLAIIAAAWPVVAAAQPAPVPGNRPSHPEEVALVDEGAKGFVYRRFPGGERLYTFARDGVRRSACNQGCEGGWPPVPAPADATTIGRWSVVVRYDGSRQWALDGRPVYTRFHDSPEQPVGDGFHGVWHVVPYTPARDGVPTPAAP
ncbi:MAG: hypothetical protein ABW203_04760 [Novosphingobium sp.]